MEIIEGKLNKIFNWCPDLDENAKKQMEVFADLPFVKHCALMPDSHLGMSVPIGSVVATKDVVVPSATGSDCGCGMISCQTTVKKDVLTETNKKEILKAIEERIPHGFDHNPQRRKRLLKEKYWQKFKYSFDKHKIAECEHIPFELSRPKGDTFHDKYTNILDSIASKVFDSVGTLGGGKFGLLPARAENKQF